MVKSQFPLIVMCFDDLQEETYQILEDKNIPYQIFPKALFEGTPRPTKDYSVTLGKFYAYKLKGVSHFCFIDADSFFVENIDYLFSIPMPIFFSHDLSPVKGYVDISKITGCVFSDFVSEERFEQCFHYKSIFREDEQVLARLAATTYHLKVDYRTWTLNSKRVLYHEEAYDIEHKFWNQKNFCLDTFLQDNIDPVRQGYSPRF